MKTKTIIVTLITGIVLSLFGSVLAMIELSRLDFIPFNDNDTKISTTLDLDTNISSLYIDDHTIGNYRVLVDNTLGDEIVIEHLPIDKKNPSKFSIKDNIISDDAISTNDLHELKTYLSYFIQGLKENKVYYFSDGNIIQIKMNQKWYDIYQKQFSGQSNPQNNNLENKPYEYYEDPDMEWYERSPE